jgi:hypothetical protein
MHASRNEISRATNGSTRRWIVLLAPLAAHCGNGGTGPTQSGGTTPTGTPAVTAPTDDGAAGPPPSANTGPQGTGGPDAALPATGGPGGASVDAGPSDAAPSDAPATTSTGSFPPVADFTKNGPFTATTVNNTGPNGKYTVYMPSELPANGAKSPIVGWMSGGGSTPSSYPLLPRLATDGFFVVASDTAPALGQEVELGQEILAGITWAIAENTRQGSNLFGKLDTTKIASMGYSMGGLASFQIASDPRLSTTVHISGGNQDAGAIKNLRAPAAFICGYPSGSDSGCDTAGTCDIAADNCDRDFANATTPVFYANFPGGHLGTITPPLSDRIGGMATAWLRWKLMSDATLEPMFVGPKCTFCTSPDWWRVQQKNL